MAYNYGFIEKLSDKKYYIITIDSFCRMLRIESKNDALFCRNVTFTVHNSAI